MSFSFNVRGTVAEGAKANLAVKAAFEKVVRDLRKIKTVNIEAGWGESVDVDGRSELHVEDVK